MPNLKFPLKTGNVKTISEDLCRQLLKTLTKSDFYGTCTIQVKGGWIYNVTMTQTLKAEDLNHLS